MMPMTASTIARPRRRGGGEAGVADGVSGPTSPDNGADWTGTHPHTLVTGSDNGCGSGRRQS